MALDSEKNIQTQKRDLVEAYFDAADATFSKTKYSKESPLSDIRHLELLLRDQLQD